MRGLLSRCFRPLHEPPLTSRSPSQEGGGRPSETNSTQLPGGDPSEGRAPERASLHDEVTSGGRLATDTRERDAICVIMAETAAAGTASLSPRSPTSLSFPEPVSATLDHLGSGCGLLVEGRLEPSPHHLRWSNEQHTPLTGPLQVAGSTERDEGDRDSAWIQTAEQGEQRLRSMQGTLQGKSCPSMSMLSVFLKGEALKKAALITAGVDLSGGQEEAHASGGSASLGGSAALGLGLVGDSAMMLKSPCNDLSGSTPIAAAAAASLQTSPTLPLGASDCNVGPAVTNSSTTETGRLGPLLEGGSRQALPPTTTLHYRLNSQQHPPSALPRQQSTVPSQEDNNSTEGSSSSIQISLNDLLGSSRYKSFSCALPSGNQCGFGGRGGSFDGQSRGRIKGVPGSSSGRARGGGGSLPLVSIVSLLRKSTPTVLGSSSSIPEEGKGLVGATTVGSDRKYSNSDASSALAINRDSPQLSQQGQPAAAADDGEERGGSSGTLILPRLRSPFASVTTTLTAALTASLPPDPSSPSPSYLSPSFLLSSGLPVPGSVQRSLAPSSIPYGGYFYATLSALPEEDEACSTAASSGSYLLSRLTSPGEEV